MLTPVVLPVLLWKQDKQSRWKISTHADGFRRRMLLSRADKFDDHQDAAYRSGKGTASDDEDDDIEGEEGGGVGGDQGKHEDSTDVLLKSKLIPVHDPAAGPAQTHGACHSLAVPLACLSNVQLNDTCVLISLAWDR